MNEKNQVSNKYDITLLTAFFVGSLGIHRIINKHYVTGFMMLITSIAGFVASFWAISLPVTLLIVFALSIWRFVDVIMILTKKFKDDSGNYLSYEGKFFSVKSNVVVTVMFGIALILIFITLVFIFSILTLLIQAGQM